MLNRRPVVWLGAVSILAVAAIGTLHIPLAFFNDQAAFTLGASMMRHGAVQYVDFWDIKQPGIYFFYLMAGSPFGFTERGIHSFELLYWLIFSIMLMATLRDAFADRWIVATVPLLSAGMYYAVAGSRHLTQAEALVGFPLYVALWCALSSIESEQRRSLLLFCSGFAGAIALLFKLLYLPIVVAFWVVTFFSARDVGGRLEPASIGRKAVAVCAGLAIPILATVAYFAANHALRPLLVATFVTPLQVAVYAPNQNTHVLADHVRWFVTWFFPVIVLALAGAATSMRGPRRGLCLGLVSWVIVGFGVILVQMKAWWDHHFMLFFVPLGVLAAFGLEAMIQFVRAQRRISSPLGAFATIIVLLLLFTPPLRLIHGTVHDLANNGFAMNADGDLAFREYENPEYRQILVDSAFLKKPGSLPGDVFLVGEALRYYLTGLKPAFALFERPDWILPDQWQKIKLTLTRMPPAYAYISVSNAALMQRHAPDVLNFIHGGYRVVRSDKAGTWYRRKP